MLETLRRIIQEVSAARDLNTALNIIVERVQVAMSAHVCSVYLFDEERQEYRFMATRGLNQDAVGNVVIKVGEGLVGLVGERAEPINLDHAPSHPRYHHVDEIGEEPFLSFLGVPIIYQRKVLGVLIVQQRVARRYDANEEAFLITLSAQLAGVILHARATGSLQDLEMRPAGLDGGRFQGAAGAPGVAIGTAAVMFHEIGFETIPDRDARDVPREVQRFTAAIEATRQEIRDLTEKLSGRVPEQELALFSAYDRMLDESIAGEVLEVIRAGQWAEGALRRVIETHVAAFESMNDEYLAERGADVRDLGHRVLAHLQDSHRIRVDFPSNTVLVADELTTTMLSEVPLTNLVGMVSVRGSRNSHAAIMAHSLGIPAVVGAEDLPIDLVDGTPLVVDGFEGAVISYPNKEQLTFYQKVVAEEAALIEGLGEIRNEPCVTPDGHRVQLWVNTALIADAYRSLERGAEGVGLYRTEIPFMMKDRFPTEEEQRVIYREHLEVFAPRPVTMRTLDIGGDKTLPYFPISEENPFLGWRGIRVTLDHPELFLSQVRAMIRANEGIDTDLRIMLPMVSSVTEVDEALRLIQQCYREIVEEGVEVEMPDVGVMIEVPSAVYQARDIIKRVDFLSVGSNDLIQYLLAVDRNNPRVAELFQEFHPAVLHALQSVVDAAHAEKKTLSICGEMAGNPASAALLIAMGYDLLSMNSPNLLIVKAMVRELPMTRAKAMLKHVMKMDNAYLIRDYVDQELRAAGLGRLLRKRGERSGEKQP